jgi:SAM-dependent methyltransferase
VTWYQEWFGEEYLELYSHRDENEARKQVAFFARQFGAIDGCVLDLACGVGRHLVELRASGYAAIGCDLSYTLLRTGMTEYRTIAVTRADMRALPLCSASISALVNFFTSFGYFATEEENVKVVEEMSRVMKEGAGFLFDYLNVDRELQKLVQKERRGDVMIERWFDGSDRSFNKRITIGHKRYLERVRGYDLAEISEMFSRCRLRIRDAFGDFDGSPFTRSSPRLILVGDRER